MASRLTGYQTKSTEFVLAAGIPQVVAKADPDRVVIAFGGGSISTYQCIIQVSGMGQTDWRWLYSSADLEKIDWEKFGPLVTGQFTATVIASGGGLYVYECLYRG